MTRLNSTAATTTVFGTAILTLGTGAASATGPVPINGDLRNCDFSLVQTAVQRPHALLGHGTAQFHNSGSAVVADVDMMVPNEPGTHFDVGLILEPRPSSSTCGPGDPATAFTGVDTDGTGHAHLTLQAPLRAGTTGVFVMIEAQNPHNQAPGEFYTSEFVAPV